jgi:hypothetical protein
VRLSGAKPAGLVAARRCSRGIVTDVGAATFARWAPSSVE